MADSPKSMEFEATVQMPQPLFGNGGEQGPAGAAMPRQPVCQRPVAIVTGSSPGLSQETYSLRCERLQIASLLLFGGYATFLLKSLFYLDRLVTPADWVLLWIHAAITGITGIVGLRLATGCQAVRKHLVTAELLVFGGSATLFVLLTYVQLTQSAERGYIFGVLPPWLLLIFTYALFIPNTWQRAAAVISAMAAAPIVTILVVRFTSEAFASVVTTNPQFSGFVLSSILVVLLAATISISGVRTMGRLRREAFEARQIGQYRLKRSLGSGGMGDVFLAEHVLLKRPCAIKLIKPEKAGDPQAMARFEHEVQATARLTHWNTVEIFDYGRAEDGSFYYVMEYLPGMNLDQLVKMHGPLPAERVIHLMTQTCDALEEAHAEQLIHRDIKPANIFAAHRGRVYDVAKLLDFGLAKPLASAADSSLTQEGTVAGSPLFMSPEQVTGETPDGRSDIYSLGIVMYFLLTGRPPFEGENPMKVLIAQAHESPPPVQDVNPDIPADLAAIVMRCLEKDRDERFQEVSDLRQRLVDCADAGRWTREDAQRWWQCSGCPQKKALDAEVFGEQPELEPELAAV